MLSLFTRHATGYGAVLCAAAMIWLLLALTTTVGAGANARSFGPAGWEQWNEPEIVVMARISIGDGIVGRSHPA